MRRDSNEDAAARLQGRAFPDWLLRVWQAAARHAERPDRFVPYC